MHSSVPTVRISALSAMAPNAHAHESSASSDLELYTDSSSSGGSPRALFETSLPAASDFHEDKSDDVMTETVVSHVSIKPNLKLMSNSERGKYYRRKRKNYAAELSASVAKLRRQVAALVAAQQLRQELVVGHRQTPLGSLAKLVKEYCSLFEYGTPVMVLPASIINSGDANPGSARPRQPARVATASSQQARFLHATMEEHVGFGEFAGIALLLDQWERYSKYHTSLRFELKSLSVVSPTSTSSTEDNDEPVLPVIVVRVDLHVRYSLETIEQVFPHLLDDAPLVQELIGLDVTYPCVNTFYFSASGKIERYNPEVDFMGALATKIRSMAGVAHVLSHALIAKDHMIGVLDADEDHVDADVSHNEPQVVQIYEDEDNDDYEEGTAAAASRWDPKTSAEANDKSEARPTSPVVISRAKPSKSRLGLDFILS
ncbi:hypothetical protein Gpo141_00005347 [Globisporangium polare]